MYIEIVVIFWTMAKKLIYGQVSNISRTKSQYLKDYHTVLRLSLPSPLKPGVKSRMKTGNAPTTSEWWTILLPIKVRLMLEVLLYVSK